MSFFKHTSKLLTSISNRSMSAKASVSGVQIASTTNAQSVEGNSYFPPSSLDMQYFKPSAAGTSSVCGWKGKASYYDVHVGDTIVRDAAWYYANTTTSRAKPLEGYVAFYKNKVTVA